MQAGLSLLLPHEPTHDRTGVLAAAKTLITDREQYMKDLRLDALKWDSAEEMFHNIPAPLKNIGKFLDSFPPDKLLCRIEDWENLSDASILKRIRLDKFTSSTLYAITDISYIKDEGLFVVEPENIKNFISIYSKKYRECFFNGDVIFILPRENMIIYFHHCGELLLFSLPKICQ